MTHGEAPGTTLDTDVIVVGAGPAGLTTAMEVAASGAKVTILEKRGEPALSRAGVVQPRVLEFFAMRGLAEQMIAKGKELNGIKHRNNVGIWAGLPGVNYNLLDGEYNWILVLSQIEVERILAARCVELGVEIRRNAAVTAVTQDAGSVTVTYVENGVEKTATAKYLVGADGGRSAVRESLGLAWTGTEARNLAVNVDAELPFPFPADGKTVVINTTAGWGLCYPLSEQVTRFAVIDAQTMLGVGRDYVVDEDSAFQSLERVFGSDYGRPKARISQFHDALFRIETIRRGRVALVGESTRIHYPASGVGMNFAIQDAANLGWKIAAEVQGWGPENVLDSYETERGPAIDDHLDNVRSQTAIQFRFDEETVALKDTVMNDILPVPEAQKVIAARLAGFSTHYGDGTGLVGGRIGDQPLIGGGRLFDAIDASGYTLVQPAGAAAVQGGKHLAVVQAEIPGAEGEHVLVRPDGYVDFVGDAPAVAVRIQELRLL